MVSLNLMNPKDFDVFLNQAIDVYAQDNIKSGNWQPDTALEKSREEFQQLLPDGIQTKNQFLFTILDETSNNKIGVLWVQIKMDSPHRKAFICDFIIDPQYRGQGYGKQTLKALDEKLTQMKVESVSLHVFAHNTNAIGLYETMGFLPTNIYMKKTLVG